MDEEKIKQIIAELLGKAPLARTGIANSLLSRGFDTPVDREKAFLEGILGAGSYLAGGESTTDDGFLPGGPANTSAFSEKMDWIQNNPNLTTEEKQLLGIVPQEAQTAWQQKMQYIRDNPGGGSDSSNLGFTPNVDAISDLSSDFVGGLPRGLDTPSKRHSIGEIMGALNPQEQNKVKMILSNMTPEQQEIFLNGMMDGSINPGGYGVQNEQILY